MNLQLDYAKGLLAKAHDDYFVVRRLAEEADAPGWVLGFHAEQAVEKALKAVLSSADVAYPRTHNLVMLVELLRKAQLPFIVRVFKEEWTKITSRNQLIFCQPDSKFYFHETAQA